jgi:hypothetical protein
MSPPAATIYKNAGQSKLLDLTDGGNCVYINKQKLNGRL